MAVGFFILLSMTVEVEERVIAVHLYALNFEYMVVLNRTETAIRMVMVHRVRKEKVERTIRRFFLRRHHRGSQVRRVQRL